MTKIRATLNSNLPTWFFLRLIFFYILFAKKIAEEVVFTTISGFKMLFSNVLRCKLLRIAFKKTVVNKFLVEKAGPIIDIVDFFVNF